MSFTKEDLANIATLARITVAPDEEEKMLADMQAILGYVSEINAVGGDVERVKGTHYNIVREDVMTRNPGENTENVLREAPDTEDSYVKVAQVLK
ncbi:MAG: Asp-tRNA(Asn)/Glu-tRNA(Gln) amidotransferase subunit GatC [Candidatus Paceibacterota bacterium]